MIVDDRDDVWGKQATNSRFHEHKFHRFLQPSEFTNSKKIHRVNFSLTFRKNFIDAEPHQICF